MGIVNQLCYRQMFVMHVMQQMHLYIYCTDVLRGIVEGCKSNGVGILVALKESCFFFSENGRNNSCRAMTAFSMRWSLWWTIHLSLFLSLSIYLYLYIYIYIFIYIYIYIYLYIYIYIYIYIYLARAWHGIALALITVVISIGNVKMRYERFIVCHDFAYMFTRIKKKKKEHFCFDKALLGYLL